MYWRDSGSPPAILAALHGDAAGQAEAFLEDPSEDFVTIEDPALLAYLGEVLSRVRGEGVAPDREIRILVLRDSERNAGAWSNDVIALSLGLLVAMDSEAELAFLLGHELVHVLEYHQASHEWYEQQTVSHVDRMRLSRALERRADRGGLQMLQEGGYPLTAAAAMLDRLDGGVQRGVHRIRSWESHEDLGARIRAVKAWSKGSTPLPNDREAFETALDPIRLSAVQMLIEDAEYEWARIVVERHLRRRPESGHAHFLRSEITRREGKGGENTASQRADLERAIEFAPESPEAFRALGFLLRRSGARARSNELLRRYLELDESAFDRRLVERMIEAVPRSGS